MENGFAVGEPITVIGKFKIPEAPIIGKLEI